MRVVLRVQQHQLVERERRPKNKFISVSAPPMSNVFGLHCAINSARDWYIRACVFVARITNVKYKFKCVVKNNLEKHIKPGKVHPTL